MIQILPPEEARKIAAGEVIDRPSALVREFLDNAIDSGGRVIEVLIEQGGAKLTEVSDDGAGMGKEDIELCCRAHATSKIRSLDDLRTSVTLGFRGEALAAAAAVSRLEILSSTDGLEAWKLTAAAGRVSRATPSRRAQGTSVRAFGLFDMIPARKRFLKKGGSEAASCRQIYNEKALAFPELSFRFSQDGEMKSFLPPVSTYSERFAQIFLEEREKTFLHQVAAEGNGFTVSIVAGGPELFRNDRRQQFVFANNRRIQDFALLQALEYGLQGWFPNGAHPLGAVFIDIDPALADFNIHPAKREARFTESAAIHHAISTCLRDFCRSRVFRDMARQNAEAQEIKDTPEYGLELSLSNDHSSNDSSSLPFQNSYNSTSSPFLLKEKVKNSFSAESAEPYEEPEGNARCLGRLFGLFIIIERATGFSSSINMRRTSVFYMSVSCKAPYKNRSCLWPCPSAPIVMRMIASWKKNRKSFRVWA